jgi:hypothetical protein
MSIATLGDIISKIRRLTGSGNSDQLTDSQIIDYINSFYLYDFPAQFRSLKLKDRITFNTRKGVDTYAFDSEHFSTIEMPCYCAKREIKLFQDPWSFYGAWFNWQFTQQFDIGDGTSGPYQMQLSDTPIIRSVYNNPITRTVPSISNPQFTDNYVTTAPPLQNPDFTYRAAPSTYVNQVAIPGRVQNILITAESNLGTLNVTDDGNGNLIGNAFSGTIDYDTGLISNLVFGNITTIAALAGSTITVMYNPATLAIPLAILFYQNQFTLRPVPDRGYTIELTAYRLPSQTLLGSDPSNISTNGVPELAEWWETIAFGAAKKIYEDRLDPDGVQLMEASLYKQYELNMTRTCAQIGKQSMNTLFRDQLSYNYGGGGGWGFGSQ